MKELGINYKEPIQMYMKVQYSSSSRITPFSQLFVKRYEEKQAYFPRINKELTDKYGLQFFVIYTEKDNYIGKRCSYKIEFLRKDCKKVKKFMEHHFIVPLKKYKPYESEFNFDFEW